MRIPASGCVAKNLFDGQGQGIEAVAGGVELAEQGGELSAEGGFHGGRLVHRGFTGDREETGPGQGGGL